MHRLMLKKFRAARLPHLRTPNSFGLAFETVGITAVDGGSLFGWWIPATAPVSSGVSPVAVVLHGWGANASMMLDMAPTIQAMGFHGLYLDARCHGRSSDADFSSLPRFTEDIEAARTWVLKRTDIDPEKIFAIGHSVGAGAALLSGTRTQWAGVVSLSAFAHPRNMMARYMNEHRIPKLFIQPYVMTQVQKLIGFRFDDIAPENTLRQLRCPVMLVHGMDDQDVPLYEAQRLMANAPDARQFLLPGIGHDLRPAMALLAPEVTDFMMQLVSQHQGESSNTE